MPDHKSLRDAGGSELRNLFVLQAGLQNTPYQGSYQQMDMTQNRSQFFQRSLQRDLDGACFDTALFWQNVRHEMNIGKDKSTSRIQCGCRWIPME